MEFAFIGGGNMGRAMATALVEKRVCAPGDLLVVDPDPACRERLLPLGCHLAASADGRVGEAAVVVLAVKPQGAAEMMRALKPLLRADQAVLSIMAGVSLASLRAGLGHAALVRAMPNTPAQIGLGMNVYLAEPAVSAERLARVEALLGACGETVRVQAEDAIDAATAVSGSGPAYVFFVAEHWIEAAQQLGFSAEDAARLVQQTLLGATELWKRQKLPVATLREQVTSKGGTTAAALETFRAKGVGEGLQEGIVRAYRRAKELSS
jgi:pyrroline-5-carboxylate reductase